MCILLNCVQRNLMCISHKQYGYCNRRSRREMIGCVYFFFLYQLLYDVFQWKRRVLIKNRMLMWTKRYNVDVWFYLIDRVWISNHSLLIPRKRTAKQIGNNFFKKWNEKGATNTNQKFAQKTTSLLSNHFKMMNKKYSGKKMTQINYKTKIHLIFSIILIL